MTIQSYCALRDCPTTSPSPRCEKFATVAAALIEILRRAPDELVRRAPLGWLRQWFRSFVLSEKMNEQCEQCGIKATQPSLSLLSAAGFAPALQAALKRAQSVETVVELSASYLTVLSGENIAGHMESLLPERSHVRQWLDAARAVFEALVSWPPLPDGSLVSAKSKRIQCKLVWSFMHKFSCGAWHVPLVGLLTAEGLLEST